MIDIYKINYKDYGSINDLLNINGDYNMYMIKCDNKTVGYGQIFKDYINNNTIFIFIEKEYRGQGYGKKLFFKLLDEYKKLNHNEIKLCIENNDLIMNHLINDCNGLVLSNDYGYTTYLVKLF